jgi:hypothetical protein
MLIGQAGNKYTLYKSKSVRITVLQTLEVFIIIDEHLVLIKAGFCLAVEISSH